MKRLLDRLVDEGIELGESSDQTPKTIEIRRGLSMSEQVELVKEIEGLKRSQLQEQHEIQTALDELKRTVQGLEGTMANVRLEVERARASFSTGITIGDVRREVADCMAHPDSAVCASRRAEIQAVVAEDRAQREEEEEAEEPKAKDDVHHESADEYLACPQCRMKFVAAARRIPAFEDEILAGIGERDAEKLIASLQGRGYKVEGPKVKQRDWLTGL